MTGIIKTDQLQGAQSSTITIPTGNKISIADSATVGTLNATTMSGTPTFSGNVSMSGTADITGNTSVGGTFGVTGVHTIGNNAVYKSDGGNVTQNIGDAVHKHYLRHNSGTTIVVSFNNSSLTDNGTAHYTGNFTNNMSNTVHIHTSIHEGGTDYFRYTMPITYGTSSHVHKVRLLNQSHFLELDIGTVGYGILGDLA